MRTNTNSNTNTTGHVELSILAGWTPCHRRLEADAAELADLVERDDRASGLSRDNRWAMVAAALRSIGCTDVRPTPMHRTLEG